MFVLLRLYKIFIRKLLLFFFKCREIKSWKKIETMQNGCPSEISKKIVSKSFYFSFLNVEKLSREQKKK